ncbi:MAG: transporter substrate-binding domain-containing protein [Gemmatimonadota bacterium]|nr:transporter substrate-binding domain-containing protein [Gemmatimonadota bacterium]
MTYERPLPAPLSASVLRPAAGALLLVIGVACGNFPRDPNGTLARVRGGTMRVGVVENQPWTTLPTGGGAGGLEGALAAELARELGARVEWVRATESQLMEALKLHELDLAIGGLTDVSPWKQHVAFTKPFYTDTIVVGAPIGMTPLRSLRGQAVAVSTRDPAARGYVRKKGGVPRPIADLGQAPGLVAAPTWQLPSLGYSSAGITLHKAHHVMAAPPGENAWLAQIERSLRLRMPVIPEILRTSRP